MAEASDQLSYKTVFVQNVPTSCTREQFHEVFSTIGPIREAFVNKPKNLDEYIKDNRSLVGFVTYLSHDDAEKAAKSRPGTFVIDKKRLKVRFARKKISEKKKRKMLQTTETNTPLPKKQNAADIIADFGFEIVPLDTPIEKQIETVVEDQIEQDEFESESFEKSAPSKTYKVGISDFPESYTVQNFVELWKRRNFDMPEQFSIEPEEEGTGRKAIVEMGRKQAALRILTHLNGLVLGNSTVKATLMLDPNSKDFERTAKRSRMIVRNLSFGIKEKQLREAFEKYGTITEIKIPLKPNGKKAGYAFVQLSHLFESLRAIKEVNMTEIGGRTVAVDLCLPSGKYKKIVEAEKSKKMEEVQMNIDNEEDNDEDQEDESEDEASDDESSDDDANSDDDQSDSNTDESDKDSDLLDESEDEKENKSKEKGLKKPIGKKVKSNDVEEGKTVFLRNLSFDVTQKNLEEEMKKFGTSKYCLIVMNADTGFSKGTAFVQFDTKEMAEKCVSTIQDDKTKLVLYDRRIIAAIAQSREGLKKHLKEKKNEEKDKDTRNIYLANEGVVRPDVTGEKLLQQYVVFDRSGICPSPRGIESGTGSFSSKGFGIAAVFDCGTLAAEGVSEMEMKKRVKIEMMKRHKLKNPNIIVSTTRICIHNIPRSVDDKKLKQICRDALKGVKDAVITECRVMRDLKHANEEGVGRSLGYAFVNYSKHEHALFALRTLNNNPEIFDADKRPIVEFSLEDKRVLQIKEQRRIKQIAKNEEKRIAKMAEAQNEASKPPPNKKALRIEKIREERRKSRLLKKSNFKETAKVILTSKQERPSFMGSSCVTSSGKKAPLSKHIGPKIRKRNKTQVIERLKESKKLNKPKRKKDQRPIVRQTATVVEPQISYKTYRKQQKIFAKQKQSRFKKSNSDFDKLVAKYTQKFKSNKTDGNAPRLKWFDN